MGVKRGTDYAVYRRLRRIATVTSTAIILWATPAITRGADGSKAEATEPHQTKPATAPVVEVLTERGVKIPMRDGVHLVAFVVVDLGSRSRPFLREQVHAESGVHNRIVCAQPIADPLECLGERPVHRLVEEQRPQLAL